MGQSANNPTFISRAKAITPTDTISYSTNLNSAAIYVGDGGNLNVIMAGVSGGQVSTQAKSLSIETKGNGYTNATGLSTTVGDGFSGGSGLTVDITVGQAVFSGPVGGNGNYTIGAIDTFVPALAGASGTIDSMLQSTLTLTQGGSGYNETLPYTYATTPPAASFTGPTGGNGRYIAPSNASFTQVTSFSPAGAVGTIDNAGFPGGPGFGNPTSITITGGLDSYADGTIVEILQVLDDGGSGSVFGNYTTDIQYPTSQPSGSNILYGVQTPPSGNIPQIGNKLISQQPGVPGGGVSKIPAGTSITAVSESGGIYTLTLSANTTGSFSGVTPDDELKIYNNVGYGSTFTVSRNGGGNGTGLTISVTETENGAASFTGPNNGNSMYYPPAAPWVLSTTFSPAGAVGAIVSTDGSGSMGGGVPTSISITSGLDNYADGTVVEILQTLDASYMDVRFYDIVAAGIPSGSTQLPLYGTGLRDDNGVGNPIESRNAGGGSNNGKIPAGTTITAVSADKKTITISAATTSALADGVDELYITETNAFGSTFTVVAGATGIIKTFAIDNPGSGYNIGDVVSPTLIGAGTPATFSVVAPYSTGNPATVTLAGINGYAKGQEVELRQSITFTGVTPASSFASPSTDLYMTSAQQTVQVGDAVTTTSGGIFAAGTTITQVISQTQFVISNATIGDIPASTTITFTKPSSSSGSGSKVTITSVEGVGEILTAVVNNGGTGYVAGQTVNVIQAGSTTAAAIKLIDVDQLPTLSQAVQFTGVPTGTYLPVQVDYVVNATSATSLLACY